MRRSENRPTHVWYRQNGQGVIQNPDLDGKPIIMASVKGQNVFAILATADKAMREFGYEKEQRRAILRELQNVSDNDMFHARLRFHFTIMADQVPDIDRAATRIRNPHIDDCDNCDEDGMMPNYNPGGHGEQVPCDMCGG